jgi:hypothetical protein
MTSNKRARYDDDVVQNGELTSAAEGFFEALGMTDACLPWILWTDRMLEKPRLESPTVSSICTSTQLVYELNIC